MKLSEEAGDRARQLRRRRPDATLEQIGAEVGAEVQEVRVALATLRTRNPQAQRATVNITLRAAAWIKAQARPGQPLWEVVDDLVDRLASLPRAG